MTLEKPLRRILYLAGLIHNEIASKFGTHNELVIVKKAFVYLDLATHPLRLSQVLDNQPPGMRTFGARIPRDFLA